MGTRYWCGPCADRWHTVLRRNARCLRNARRRRDARRRRVCELQPGKSCDCGAHGALGLTVGVSGEAQPDEAESDEAEPAGAETAAVVPVGSECARIELVGEELVLGLGAYRRRCDEYDSYGEKRLPVYLHQNHYSQVWLMYFGWLWIVELVR